MLFNCCCKNSSPLNVQIAIETRGVAESLFTFITNFLLQFGVRYNTDLKQDCWFLDSTLTGIASYIFEALQDVYESNYFILGNRVKSFEESYSKFNKTNYCVGVGNGLDALIIALRALGIGPGDEVIVPSNTYIASLLATVPS